MRFRAIVSVAIPIVLIAAALASSPSKRWSTMICAQRGWKEFNPSVNGLGFVNNRAHDGSTTTSATPTRRRQAGPLSPA
jgi:hypothetical protein